jgi:formamidopyrimidine-DNA glycosylase
MMELPEAVNMAGQINEIVQGKRIAGVTAAHTPHRLAWYYGEPETYADLLVGRTVGTASPFGGMVEIEAGDARILFGEGVVVRFHYRNKPRPARHQLLIDFDDGSALSASIQMYGGLGAFPEGGLDNPYYRAAREKPSPLSKAFHRAYLDGIVSGDEAQKLSLKALLTTNQRIPGLGNGVLQDILFNARMHPKRKVSALSEADQGALFRSVKTTLAAMAAGGGRDIELDLFGQPGGYRTILSKNTVGRPCPSCGAAIRKEAYMGGAVYYCPECQRT